MQGSDLIFIVLPAVIPLLLAMGSPCLSSPTAELGWATRAATRYGSEPRRVLDQRLSTSPPLKRTPRPHSRCMISGTLPAAEALP